MNALYDFLLALCILSVIVGVMFVVAYGVIVVIDWWRDLTYRDDLSDVFARDRALEALARIQSDEPYNGTDLCRLCNGHILTENSYEGICNECWSIPRCDVCDAIGETVEWCGECGCCTEHCQEYVSCRKVRDAEWQALMAAISDEQAETEDHR